MTATEYVIEAVGGIKVFKGRTAPTATELRDRVRTGLPYQSLESIRERLKLSLPEAAVILHVSLAHSRAGATGGSSMPTNRIAFTGSHASLDKRSPCWGQMKRRQPGFGDRIAR